MGEELRSFFEQEVALDDSAWKAMEKVIALKTLPKKAHFLRENEICRQIGFIMKGYVRLYFLADGEEVTKDFNFEKSFCGSYASFKLQEPSRFNIIAMEALSLVTIGHDDLFRLYDQYPAFQKLGRISMENMFIRKELREASFLLDSAEKRYNDLLQQNPSIVQRVPLKYLASYLGMTAETLSRIRANKGVIKRKKVSSSMASFLGYDPSTSTLEIEFKSGEIWQYIGVPSQIYDEMTMGSVGQYFQSYIKGMYEERRVR